MKIVIREFEKKDKKDIANLFNDFIDYIKDLDNLKRTRRIDDNYGKKYLKLCLNLIKKKNGVIYIATDNEKVIGFIMGIIRKQSKSRQLDTIYTLTGEVIELYIDEKYRRKNIGTTLMKKVENYFKKNNCTIMWLSVFEPNVKAHNFYKKSGFTDRIIEMIKPIN